MYRLALQRIGSVSFSTTPKVLASTSNTGSKNILFEPEYLDHLKPEIPLYDRVNVEIKGYDYPILESYQKYIHKIAASLDIDNDESWALPPQKLEVTRTEPNSSIVDAVYKLCVYKRYIQVADVPANILPIFIEAIQTGLPEGVDLTVEEHSQEHEDARYVPDLELKELELKLEEMGGPTVPKPVKRK